jgi:hypothetical protein
MFGAILLIGGVVLGQAGSPADAAQLKLEVRRLVRQMNAPRLADRQSAEERLTSLGPVVLDYLPPASDSLPAEVEQRLKRVRQVLQQQMARSTAQPSTVTLQGRLPLDKILAAIEAQTGNKIAGQKELQQLGLNPTLEVNFDKTPFWQALDQVREKAGLTIYNFGEEKAVTLRPAAEKPSADASRTDYRGPFRFEPIRIEARRDLRESGQQSLGLVLEVAWEPKLSPISLQLPLDRVEAVDENGHPIPVDGKEAESEVPVTADALASQLRVPLVLPPRSVKQIARLKGSLIALLPGKLETFRFQDLEKAKDAEQRIAGVTVVFEGARKRDKLWELRVRVRFDQAGESLQSHRTWIFDNEVYLEDAQGKRVTWGTYETTRRTESEIGVAYLFGVEKPLTGYTLVYKTPGAILSIDVPYEIKDIPLP